MDALNFSSKTMSKV